MGLFKSDDIKQELKKTAYKKIEGIETQTPANLPPLKNRKNVLMNYLAQSTSDHLKVFFKFLFGRTTNMKKADIINAIAEAHSFSTVKEFEEWFFYLPELTQKILHEIAFMDFVPVHYLEKKWNVSLLIKDTAYSWRTTMKFNPEFQLDFLPVYNNYGSPYTAIPWFLFAVLSLWLVPPPLFHLPACRAQGQTEPKNINSFNNSLLISDVYPLLCDALQGIQEGLSEADREKKLRNGFNKSELNELRSSTGFLPFGMAENAPDSVDLAARFMLCVYNYKPKRPRDGQEGIRNLVLDFFSAETQYPKKWYSPDRAFLEYSICIDHLSRTPGYYLDDSKKLPASRKIFHDILLHIAQDGDWFDADKLSEHIRITRKNFSFCDPYLEGTLRVKAEAFIIDDAKYTHGYDDFHPEGIMHYYLLLRPLFKAYCYIFAALGLLEITQAAPPLVRHYRNKQYPLSPYDSLSAIRITELGRWSLGLTSKRPPRPSQEYHAIADRELLLVTVQGNSLERKLYLDKIGRRLGEDRWRISPGSFIAGCVNARQIAERVERFRVLIDRNPAPHWEQLFKKVIERSGLFSKSRSDMLVYDLPENQEVLEELLRDPELKRIARRVEGRMLAVAAKDQKKFFALLNEHGIAHL